MKIDRLTNKAGRVLAAALLCLAAGGSAHAALMTYDFDTLGDGTALAGQYAGLHFTHATVALAGISLNEITFPPRSGTGVVYDDGGAIVITFDTLASGVAGYFTYLEGLTLSAYDSADNLIAVATSAYGTNAADGTGDPGSVPNELLSVSASGDLIARIVISGAPGGASLVLDDLTVTTAAAAIPEPGTLPLIALGAGALVALCGRRRMA